VKADRAAVVNIVSVGTELGGLLQVGCVYIVGAVNGTVVDIEIVALIVVVVVVVAVVVVVVVGVGVVEVVAGESAVVRCVYCWNCEYCGID